MSTRRPAWMETHPMKTTLSFENDDEQLDRCKEEVRNGSHLEGRTKLFQRKCSKSSPSSLGITVAPIMCPDGVVNDSFRSTLLRFIRRRQSTLSNMEEEPFKRYRKVAIDHDRQRYHIQTEAPLVAWVSDDTKWSADVRQAASGLHYPHRQFGSIDALVELFHQHENYLKQCQEIIEASVQSCEQRTAPPDNVTGPPEVVKTPLPKIVLLDCSKQTSCQTLCTTVREIKQLGCCGQSCVFVLAVPSSLYSPNLAQSALTHGLHAVMERNRNWEIELMNLDMGAARDRAIIDEAQVVLNIVHNVPISVEVTDNEARIQYANKKFEAETGYPLESVRGVKVKTVMRSHANEDATNFFKEIDQALSKLQAYRGVYFTKTSADRHYPIETYLVPHARAGRAPLHLAMKSSRNAATLNRLAMRELLKYVTQVYNTCRDGAQHLVKELRQTSSNASSVRGEAVRSALDAPVLPPHGQTADTAPADVQRNMKASEIDSIEVASVVVGATRDNIVQAMKGMEGAVDFCVQAEKSWEDPRLSKELVNDRFLDAYRLLKSFRLNGCDRKTDILSEVPDNIRKYIEDMRVATARQSPTLENGHRMSTLEEDGHDKKCVELEMTYESHQGLVRSMPPAARKALKEFRLWSCDVIKLERSVQDYGPLLLIGMELFRDFNICEYLQISECVMARWLHLMENNYRSDISYHTSTHAADVLQATAFMLKQENSNVMRYIDNFDAACLLIAAVMHDIGHAGVNNMFLLSVNHPLAHLYARQSIMELYHCSFGLFLTERYQKCDIFRNLDLDKKKKMYERLRGLIVATDITSHFSYSKGLEGLASRVHLREDFTGSGQVALAASEVDLITCGILKAADISNPCREFSTCKEWVARVGAEFVKQDDLESDLAMARTVAVLPRKDYDVPRSQIGFGKHLVLPLFKSLSVFLGNHQIVEQCQRNIEQWQQLKDDGVVFYPPPYVKQSWDTHSLRFMNLIAKPLACHCEEQKMTGRKMCAVSAEGAAEKEMITVFDDDMGSTIPAPCGY